MNIKWIFPCLLVVFGIGSLGLNGQVSKTGNTAKSTKPYVPEQLAVSALGSLKRLKAKIEVGIPYNDYLSVVGDTRYAVNDYLDNPVAAKTPSLNSKLRDALKAYTLVAQLWKAQIENNGEPFLFCATDGIQWCHDYPESVMPYDYPLVSPQGEAGSPSVGVKVLREAAWNVASAKITDANELLNHGEPSPKTSSSLPSDESSVDIDIRATIKELRRSGFIN
jgi:hypothetical protein